MDPEFEQAVVVVRRFWRLFRKRIMAAAVVVVVIWALGSTMYKVEADSRGVVLRLGRFTTNTPPGLHFKLPWPIDLVYTVPVERVQSLEFGYRTAEAGRRTRYAPTTAEHKTMARMLTADLNLAHVEWVVQYRIQTPEDYLFKIGGEQRSEPARDARDLIRDVSEAVMRQIIGDASVDSVITIGRERIATEAKKETQRMLDGFGAGIRIVGVKLQSATPPDLVKDAFDAVNRAKQGKERVINEAKGERNRLIPAARGQKDRVITEAEGYALRVQKQAEGRANAFLARLTEYEKAPDVTRTRLYIEAMQEILTQVDRKIVIDESVKGMLPLLHLGTGETALSPVGSRQTGGER